MTKTLKEISQIRIGFYSQETVGSGIPYLQARQFDENGNLIAAPDTFLTPDSKCTTQLLKDGDVLFAGKGNRNFAWCYRRSIGDAVASGIFFVISPVKDMVIPEYLSAIFNHPVCQTYFAQLGSGTNIKSIRKTELEDMIIPVVPLETQAKIVAMHDLHIKDKELTLNLLQKKNDLYESLINTLVNSN